MGKSKKLWAHYEQVKTIIGLYIVLFFAVPALSLMISYIVYSAEIEAGEQGALEMALQVGLKWYAILMPIITVLFLVWFLYYSGKVEFTDASLNYYPYIFSKTPRIIHYNEVTECIISDGLWKHKSKYIHGRKVMFFNKNNIILSLGLFPKLCLCIILIFDHNKVKIIDDNEHCRSIDGYFKVNFFDLKREEQLKILKYYCKFTRTRYKTGKEILHRETE